MAKAIKDYTGAYGAGDRDRLVGAFAEGGHVAFGAGKPIEGEEALRKAHERIGTFNFRVERVHECGPSSQAVEGKMIALRKGEELVEHAVPFAAFADLVDGGNKFTSFRLYYDVGKVYAAIKIADAE